MKQYPITLRQIINTAESALHSIDDDLFNHKSTPNKWSKKEILGHLIDSAYNNHQRFIRAEEQGNLIFPGYNQPLWVIRNNYQNRDKREVIDSWFQVNQHLSFLIEQIPEDVMNRKTRDHNFHLICMNLIQEGVSTTLSYLVWDYLFHLEHHLKQIIPGYQSLSGNFQK